MILRMHTEYLFCPSDGQPGSNAYGLADWYRETLVLTEPIKFRLEGLRSNGVLESSQRTLRFSAMSEWQ
jgi:hypothetical protein